ncbi:MAG: NifB/NifX family molybdenum-iron cluster-binding protein [Dehalococcoidales bacterium]|jgi:predicted Fe-Mo cluster-binding NifX family protein|nr:NifB/NifX family molybdenum-iron cluster-binding protein [Dehalococcoidales bacterium]
MIIAISASSTELDGQVNPRFGRCEKFIIVNSETMDFEVIDNEGEQAGGGAGVATAQKIAGKGVGVVITGNCGPNAYKTLTAAGIKVITGVTGTIKNAIEEFKDGKLTPAPDASVNNHFGRGNAAG